MSTDQTADIITETPELSTGNSEAAKYRRQLRDTETERDLLKTQITAWQTDHAETVAAKEGVNAAALWASGADLQTLIGENGLIDQSLLGEAIQTARDILGIKALPKAASSEGAGNVGEPIRPASPVTWGTALRN
jgi:hypothetical protein